MTSIYFLILGPAFAADEISVATTESVPQLTAAQLLKTDIDPKVDVLKDILFVFKLYPTYVEKKDYVSIRQSLVRSCGITIN